MKTVPYRIETNRLVIRCWSPEDAPAVHHAESSSREHLKPFMSWAGQMAPTGLTSIKSVSMMTRDINGDSTPDVIVEVERAHVESSAPFDAKVRTFCKQSKPIDGLLPAPTKHRIEVLSDGTRFRPTPASKKLLDEWRAASPDVTQLEAAAPPKVDR